MYLEIEKGKWILLFKFFVDDIIFGVQDHLYKAFANEMKKEFEMSMFGEIKFFVVCKYIRWNMVYTSLSLNM